MAESPSHRFGQIVGSLLEEILSPVLQKFCDERGLYLDRHGNRAGVRNGKKVSWEDKYGNSHDLDFVIEKNGTSSKRGRPVAFIEAAWRRYTKHSRNKVQEIQGAVLPIAEKYEHDSPFLGAVLAGVFTKGSLDQLASREFSVVYLSYESVIAAFKNVGIDARFDEDTPDAEFTKCIVKIESLSTQNCDQLKDYLLAANKAGFDTFFTALRRKLDRLIQRVAILPLFGEAIEHTSIAEALKFISKYEENSRSGKFQKYEILITFSNGDEVRGVFANKDSAKIFLNSMTAQ
jgi:hypothetical protein